MEIARKVGGEVVSERPGFLDRFFGR